LSKLRPLALREFYFHCWKPAETAIDESNLLFSPHLCGTTPS
jgi:hypothetical protein